MYAGVRPSNYWFIEARGLRWPLLSQLLLILMLRTRTTSISGGYANICKSNYYDRLYGLLVRCIANKIVEIPYWCLTPKRVFFLLPGLPNNTLNINH